MPARDLARRLASWARDEAVLLSGARILAAGRSVRRPATAVRSARGPLDFASGG